MVNVVHGAKGTARRVGLGANYRMGGKTGTAQVFGVAQNEEYDEEKIDRKLRDHGLFVGFAPADDPTIAVAVVVENGGSGSSSAAPVARKVIDHYLNRLSEPDSTLQSETPSEHASTQHSDEGIGGRAGRLAPTLAPRARAPSRRPGNG